MPLGLAPCMGGANHLLTTVPDRNVCPRGILCSDSLNTPTTSVGTRFGLDQQYAREPVCQNVQVAGGRDR